MSELRVDSVKSKGGGAPNLPKGVTISGITTAVTLGATQIDVSNVNVSGVVTSGTLSGSLLSTGTPTLGLGVTINSSGLVVSGVATAGIVSATTIFGNGANLAGVGATIAPLFYNPDVSDGSLEFTATGIGITFNQQIKAGTGNVTLRLVGAAGTVVENFGVGSSVTISENKVSFTPTADLDSDTVYHINYPSGCFTNNEGTDYVGTAYTFAVRPLVKSLFTWGYGANGTTAQNNAVTYSSPIQIPGTTWSVLGKQSFKDGSQNGAIRSDGTLWMWGSDNEAGELGQNEYAVRYSSPIQIPGTTWNDVAMAENLSMATKTDGTLWSWGLGGIGQLGQNNRTTRSSPVQIPGTSWSTDDSKISIGKNAMYAIKTDNTLWSWGSNAYGVLGTNTSDNVHRSSPVQIPGTTWSNVISSGYSDGSRTFVLATKTDNTLWAWGGNGQGELGQNEGANNDKKARSSPTQIPGTTWATGGDKIYCMQATGFAIKTDGTLWGWGKNFNGHIGVNNQTKYSSPVQIPGTTWSKTMGRVSLKTDGTLWAWGQNQYGIVGNNTAGTYYSSPIQIPGTTWIDIGGSIEGAGTPLALKNL